MEGLIIFLFIVLLSFRTALYINIISIYLKQERGQVIACINLLGLNNELYCSHLTLRLRILEMGVQASLIDLSETSTQNHLHQQSAAQLLRLVYDLVVLDPHEEDVKKCSPKLLDGVLALMGKHYNDFFRHKIKLKKQMVENTNEQNLDTDTLMVFQQVAIDDWVEMSRLCLGLLMKCSHHPNPDIVAMATAKLHTILQIRITQDPQELGYLFFSINKALNTAIEGTLYSQIYENYNLTLYYFKFDI